VEKKFIPKPLCLKNPPPPPKKSYFLLTGFFRPLSSVLLSLCVIIFTIINRNYSNQSSNVFIYWINLSKKGVVTASRASPFSSISRSEEDYIITIYIIIIIRPIPVTARSKAWVFGRLPSGIVGSNSAEAWMSVSCECCVLSDRGVCVGLITPPEESYRVRCEYDHEAR